MYKGKMIPKHLGWYLVLLMLMELGYKLRITYFANRVSDKPDLFDFDPEMKGFAPVVPRKIEVFVEKVEYQEDELSSIFGPKVVKNTEKVLEIMDVNRMLDPDPNETMDIIDLFMKVAYGVDGK